MTFPTQWTQNKQQGSTVIALNTGTPIVSSGSLRMNATVSPEAITLQNTTYTNGLIAGRMRTILRVDTLSTTGTEEVGFVFMQNNPTMYNGVDLGYGVFLSAQNGLTTPRITIVKYTAGLPASPSELAFTTSFTAPTLGNPFVFEAEWIANLAVLGGTDIRARYAPGTNFASLAQVVAFTDTSSPILVSSTESLACSFRGTGQMVVCWDETSIYQLT